MIFGLAYFGILKRKDFISSQFLALAFSYNFAMSNTEKLARKLAFEYYSGSLKERYSTVQMVRTYAGKTISDNPELTSKWILEQVEESANLFWPSWEYEASELLTEFK